MAKPQWNSRAIAEAIGLFGVVASLVFVGWELRQNSIATRAATNSAVSDSFLAVNLNLSSNAELARAFAVHAGDPTAAPLEDQILMLGAWRSIFHVWSNVHRQHKNDTLDPEIYESVVQEISTYALTPAQRDEHADLARRQLFVRWAWDRERFIFTQEFQAFVDDILEGDDGQGT